MKKRMVKGLRSIVIALLVVSTLQLQLFAPPVKAVTQAEIDDLRDNASDLESEKNELQSQINELKDDKDDALAKKALLDEQSDVIRAEIANVEEQIAAYETLIAQTQAELEAAEQEEAEQYALFCKRVRAMEEQGTVSYWSVLFQATDFADLLSRLDAASEIMDSDQRLIAELEALQQEITDKKTDLENQLTEQEAAKAELEDKKAELDAQVAEAAALIAELQANQESAEALMDELDAEADRIDAQIKEMEAELAASLGTGTVGGYIWPVSSRRITSPYGNRNTGIPGASTNHKGVDIGGVGYTSEVVATKAGTVIISQRSSSYGEYVVISHGTGNTTLYAHMSSRKVSVGDYVSQGQVIGITGSTGISSGPHLHYEITENGSRVNPLNYLPGYIQAW